MLRHLTERLPFMVCPRWVHTRIQPVAERDVLEYLVRAADVEPGVYEIGGRDVTTYREMITTYARVRGLRRRRVVDVPVLTPRLSSYWVDVVTPVDRAVSHALVESLVTEVVVRDPGRTAAAFPSVAPLGLDAALRDALDRQADRVPDQLFDRRPGLRDGIFSMRAELPVDADLEPAVAAELERIGGEYAWYGVIPGWRARVLLGRLLGERLRLERAVEPLAIGTAVDWWTVARCGQGELVLRDRSWVPGEAWLGYRARDGRLVTVGAMRTKGLLGFLYWTLLKPVHRTVFRAMARQRVVRARSRAATADVEPPAHPAWCVAVAT
jgi:hypothetical protein